MWCGRVRTAKPGPKAACVSQRPPFPSLPPPGLPPGLPAPTPPLTAHGARDWWEGAGWGHGTSSVMFKIKGFFCTPSPSLSQWGPCSSQDLSLPPAPSSGPQSHQNLRAPLFCLLTCPHSPPPAPPSPTPPPEGYTPPFLPPKVGAFPAPLQTQLQETCRKRLPSGLDSRWRGVGGGAREDSGL